MSKVIAAQIKNILKTDGFFPHKGNAKGNTVIYSRNHPTAKFVRVVVDSGIHAKSGKFTGQPIVKLCYINRNKSWREITTETFTDAKKLASTIKAQEAAEKFVKTCKHCKAKKFRAKTGNTVCSNACWTAWGGKKKSANTTNKNGLTSKTPASFIAARKKAVTAHKKKPQRKAARKSSQKIVAEILPGDLVSVEEIELNKITTDYTGSILGVVMKVDQHGRVDVNWTADTSGLPEWDLPQLDHYIGDCRRTYRFKVLSRKAEWVKAS
jgi:uncharacterized Zn finger protein (UPF0148 family)